MSLPHFQPPHAGQAAETPHADIVVVYEGYASGIRGKGFCDQLVGRLGVRAEIEGSLWRSDLLAVPGIRQDAARAALNADYVLLSLRGDGELSEAFEGWLREWMPRAQGRDITLVVLFDPDTAQRQTMEDIRTHLRNAAHAAGLHFFACTAGPAGLASAGRGVNGDSETVVTMDTPLRWGLE